MKGLKICFPFLCCCFFLLQIRHKFCRKNWQAYYILYFRKPFNYPRRFCEQNIGLFGIKHDDVYSHINNYNFAQTLHEALWYSKTAIIQLYNILWYVFSDLTNECDNFKKVTVINDIVIAVINVNVISGITGTCKN